VNHTIPSAVVQHKAQSERSIRFSVIVPTYNRVDQLRRLLSALARQAFSLGRFEVLICDDGSTEDLSPVLAEVVHCHGLELIHLRRPRCGPGQARNLGLAHSRGELVAFTDSDCEPDADWLRKLDRAFTDPAVGLVGGQVDHRGAAHLSGQCVNYLMSSMLGSAGARDPRALIHMEYYPRTCNLAVRRELALAAGGFPSASHGEDLEFSHRVRALRVGVKFVPEARVVHHEQRTLQQIFGEAFLKGATRVYLGHRLRMHQLIHCLPAALVIYFLVLAITTIVARPPLLVAAAVPGLLYLLVLLALAIQGMAGIGRIGAAGLIPVCALLMHLGYGLGYLSAAFGLWWQRPRGESVDWHALVNMLPSPLRPIITRSSASDSKSS
jgi:glycosyltransferase involved in cell wall biosynthesis